VSARERSALAFGLLLCSCAREEPRPRFELLRLIDDDVVWSVGGNRIKPEKWAEILGEHRPALIVSQDKSASTHVDFAAAGDHFFDFEIGALEGDLADIVVEVEARTGEGEPVLLRSALPFAKEARPAVGFVPFRVDVSTLRGRIAALCVRIHSGKPAKVAVANPRLEPRVPQLSTRPDMVVFLWDGFNLEELLQQERLRRAAPHLAEWSEQCVKVGLKRPEPEELADELSELFRAARNGVCELRGFARGGPKGFGAKDGTNFHSWHSLDPWISAANERTWKEPDPGKDPLFNRERHEELGQRTFLRTLQRPRSEPLFVMLQSSLLADFRPAEQSLTQLGIEAVVPPIQTDAQGPLETELMNPERGAEMDRIWPAMLCDLDRRFEQWRSFAQANDSLRRTWVVVLSARPIRGRETAPGMLIRAPEDLHGDSRERFIEESRAGKERDLKQCVDLLTQCLRGRLSSPRDR